MENIQINRLNINDYNGDLNYNEMFDSLCNMSMLSKLYNVNELKDYTNFMKSRNWFKFFVGNHEITPCDITNITNYFNSKSLLQNYENSQTKWFQKNIHDLYDINEFILLDSFVCVSGSKYVFVDLCWCTERGIRIFKHSMPVVFTFIETEI